MARILSHSVGSSKYGIETWRIVSIDKTIDGGGLNGVVMLAVHKGVAFGIHAIGDIAKMRDSEIRYLSRITQSVRSSTIAP